MVTRRALLLSTAVIVSSSLLLLPPVSARCLARLDTHPAEFDVCKRGTPCFLFIAEPPMIVVDGVAGTDAPVSDVTSPAGVRSPFLCSNATALHGLAGASFDLHGPNGLWPSNKDLCVFAGSSSECTFTEMMTYLANIKKRGHPAYGMTLGVAGMLVHTAGRYRLALPSSPIYEDILFLVRRKSRDSSGDLQFFSQPLDPQAWVFVVAMFASVYGAIIFASCMLPHKLNGHSWKDNLGLWAFNFVRNTIGGDMSPDEAHFVPARAVLLSIPWLLIALVLIFYEGAFIAEQLRPALSTFLRGLDRESLCRYTVKQETATEEVFVQLVNIGNPRPIDQDKLLTDRGNVQVWNSCSTVHDCLEQVRTAAPNPNCPPSLGVLKAVTENYVTWGAVVRHAFRQNPDLCDELEVVDLRSDADGVLPIQQFSLGWFFGNLTVDERLQERPVSPADDAAARSAHAALQGRLADINAGFLRGRMDGTTRAISPYFGATNVPCTRTGRERIYVEQMRVPLLVLLGVSLTIAVGLVMVYPSLLRVAMRVDGRSPGVDSRSVEPDAESGES